MTDTRYGELPVKSLKPGRYQTRTEFVDAGLADSMSRDGVLQPMIVRPDPGGDGFEILAGERRWRAAIKAGLTSVPVIVKRGLSELEAAAITVQEHLQREGLNAIDEANSFQQLAKFGLTHAQIADKVEEAGGRHLSPTHCGCWGPSHSISSPIISS